MPGLVETSPSKICRVTRNVSPSEANTGSRESGSAEPPKTNVSRPLPLLEPPEPPSSRWLSAHAESVARPAVATEASVNARRVGWADVEPAFGSSWGTAGCVFGDIYVLVPAYGPGRSCSGVRGQTLGHA